MKHLKLILPDRILEIASEEAREQAADVATLCSNILCDYFLEDSASASAITKPHPPSSELRNLAVPKGDFDVAAEMRGFAPPSVRFAQQFVDEALKLPGVKAFKKSDGRGIGFEPNFVFIEYLMALRGGIAVSFYGRPDQHTNRLIGKGRGTSYSRAKIYRQEDLDSILPHIQKAYELKFGGS